MTQLCNFMYGIDMSLTKNRCLLILNNEKLEQNGWNIYAILIKIYVE